MNKKCLSTYSSSVEGVMQFIRIEPDYVRETTAITESHFCYSTTVYQNNEYIEFILKKLIIKEKNVPNISSLRVYKL